MPPGSKSRSPWGGSGGWKRVDIPDDFLLGAAEGGFAGLEILEDATILTADGLAGGDAGDHAAMEDPQQPGKASKQQKQKKGKSAEPAAAAASAPTDGGSIKKRKRQQQAAAVAGAEAAGDVAALQQKIAALQAENAALKRKTTGKDAAVAAAAAGGSAATDASNKRQRKKAKQDKQATAPASQHQQQQQQEVVPEVDMSDWGPLSLHPLLLKGLAGLGFASPTPIQSAVLPAAVRDRRDVIGAAQTGSGKTLAFGLPILQVLLQEREQQQAQEASQQQAAAGDAREGATAAAAASNKADSKLRALILAPTRELALQVCNHLQQLGKVAGIRVIPLVGGIAPVKQERLLSKRPAVVVATPGRYWDLMRQGVGHCADFSQLSFLVLDEADRMVQQGHYQELSSILELIPNPGKQQQGDADPSAPKHDMSKTQRRRKWEQEEVLRRLQRKGSKGRQQQNGAEQQQQEEEEEKEEGGPGSDEEGPMGSEDADVFNDEQEDDSSSEEGEQQQLEGGAADEDMVDAPSDADAAAGDEEGAEQDEQQQQGGGRRGKQLLQTFVFSATLALPAHLHKRLRKGGGGSSGAASLDNLMNRIAFRGRPAVVDLTPAAKVAERVAEAQVSVLDEDREALLYYLLARHPGRTLVFVNAVSSVRRLGALLQLLGMPAYVLHAQQQQRQRLKALDRFKANPHGILVATDVAARGLDITDVSLVLHYQLPASADVYIHRAGRTARTGGVDGLSLSLVAPKELPRWSALMRALARDKLPGSFPVDTRLVTLAQQRVTLARKIDDILRKERKEQADHNWAAAQAAAADLDLSDDEDAPPATAGSGSKKGQKKAARGSAAADGGDSSELQSANAQAALTAQERKRLGALQRELAAALAEPLQASISSKYFTGGASAACAAAVGAGPGDTAGGASVVPGAAVAATVQQAARLAASRGGRDAGGTGSNHPGAAAGLSKKAHKKMLQQQKHMALAGSGRVGKKKGGPDLSRLLMSKNELKRQKRAKGMVVVGSAGGAAVFGRDTLAPSALDVLKRANAAAGGSGK